MKLSRKTNLVEIQEEKLNYYRKQLELFSFTLCVCACVCLCVCLHAYANAGDCFRLDKLFLWLVLPWRMGNLTVKGRSFTTG